MMPTWLTICSISPSKWLEISTVAPDRGAAVLRRYGLTPQPADNGCLLPTMEDARLAALVQDLAAEGAGVVGVERQTKNLEEIFLSLTNTQTGKEVG